MHPLFQFTLDLFGSNQPVAPAVPAQVAAELVAKELQPAPPPVVHPVVPMSALASFRHPRANRESRLGGALVAFEFKRGGKRRTIGFSVGPEGLVVSAPKWVPLHEVEAALQEKSRWIIRKLGETAERHERMQARQIEWCDGTTVPFLGEPVQVLLHSTPVARGAAKAVLHGVDGTAAPTLQLALPQAATPAQIRDAVQVWLMHQARRNFIERLDHFAPQLQVQWRQLALSNARTRWGSARTDGSIRLNWRLIHFKQPVIDYVVAHELSHLRVMDHSPRFWDTVRSVVPDYAALRSQLKDEATPRWA